MASASPSRRWNDEKRECPWRSNELIYRFREHGKWLKDENQQRSIHQDLERLLPLTRGGGRGEESRELHRVGAGESSASTATDTNTSFETLRTTKIKIAEIWKSNTCGDSQ